MLTRRIYCFAALSILGFCSVAGASDIDAHLGYDKATKVLADARKDCGGYREFSWAFGIDRLVAGFACGDDVALAGDTAPLAETTQTIQVINEQVIKDQGATTLTDGQRVEVAG